MRGVIVPFGLSWPDLARWAKDHDGEDSIWSVDPDVDPIVQLSALSQHTESTKLGLEAESIADRPHLLALKQLITLDHLSRGRVVVAGEFSLHAKSEPAPFKGELTVVRLTDLDLRTD